MQKAYRNRKGFTLVEILIVVIILGILAAIVIPQFTSASSDARQSSLTSQLQTLRSQVELYKLQHGDAYPTSDGTAAGTWDWTKLTGTTTYAGNNVGPYLQQIPVNPQNQSNAVGSVATDPAVGTASAGNGFVFSQATGKIYATDKAFKTTND
jgi:general secretion pathway protein G